MRLVCPNCDAEYEVDDSVIPSDGRDVQCSSCGQTWFQQSALQLQQADQPAITVDAPQQPEPAPENTPEPDPVQDHDTHHAPDQHQPEQRQPDEAVLDVLRQEAALESEARHEEAQGGLETQPDLGLDRGSPDAAASAVSQRTARLRGIEPRIDKQTTRSDLLPDIEEINSSLQAESNVETEEARSERKRGRSGFRLGFGLILTIATILFLAYVYAPMIVEKLPASEPIMVSYVQTVEGLRTWLDQIMRTATDKMSDGAAGS